MRTAGLILVLLVRRQETGGRVRRRWYHYVVAGLIIAGVMLPPFTDAMKDGGFNQANPFQHPYQIAEAEYGEAPEILVELGYENELRFLDPKTDSAESFGCFIYREPAEGAQEAVTEGIWELTPEDDASHFYRLNVAPDGSIRLSHWIDDQLQFRWRLVQADAMIWSAQAGTTLTGGAAEWFPEGTFDGDPQQLNCAILRENGAITITPEEPVEQLILYEIRDGQETVHELKPDDKGNFNLTLTGRTGEQITFRIPWYGGNYWFRARFA